MGFKYCSTLMEPEDRRLLMFWGGKLHAALAGKPQFTWWFPTQLTVSGSFSNTSLASSLEHLSSTHSLSKCPCFVSSKTWFARLCLLRNWLASWGDNETTKKEPHPHKTCITLQETKGQANLEFSNMLAPPKRKQMLRNISTLSTVDNWGMYHHQPQHKCQRGLSELASY